MIRLNQNAWTELAAEASRHPISCCALKWRLRRRRRPGRHASISFNSCGIGSDDGASLEAARSAKWKKTRLRPLIGGTRLPSCPAAARRGVDRLRRVFTCFADHAASRAGRRHHRCPRSSGLVELGDQREPCRESLPGRRRLRKRQGTAKQEIGWSEATAASSVLAFWLRRSTATVLSRVTDAATS